jgi:hypothetical protein
MTNYRKQKLDKLAGNTPTETERVLTKLVIERVCDDMCDFYDRFYYFEGPGAMVYVPTAKEEKNSMFYMPVAALIAAKEDFQSKDMDGVAEIMRKAIIKAETLDLEKEALFIIQDPQHMSLLNYKREKGVADLVPT